MSGIVNELRAWADDRLGLSRAREALRRRMVPRHSLGAYLGGIALCLLALQVASGVLLLMHYRPSAADAHASIVRIDGALRFGGLIRGVHVWSGDLLVATLVFYPFAALVRRTFRAPAELAWVSGLFVTGAGVAMAFTGSLLPWSQAAYGNARVASQTIAHVPLVGSWLRRFLLGGDDVSAVTLVRAFGFHVAILPAVLTFLLALHFGLQRAKRGSEVARANVPDDEPKVPVYPDMITREATVWTGVLLVVITLATFLPRHPGDAADLAGGAPAGGPPPWYFLFFHTIVRAAPRELLGIESARFIVGMGIFLALLLLALPFVDRRGSKVTVYAAYVGLAAFAALEVYGLR